MDVTRRCRRQWSLVDTDHMRYCQLGAWDKAMQELDDKYGFVSAQHQWVTHIDNERKVRGCGLAPTWAAAVPVGVVIVCIRCACAGGTGFSGMCVDGSDSLQQ